MLDDRIRSILDGYDSAALSLACVGSHSALEVAHGAAACGLRSVVVTARGREQTYARHFARQTTPRRGCVDRTIELEEFADVLDEPVLQQLRDANALFVPNRSFEVYLRQRYRYAEIEQRFLVPMFGSRRLLRAEERDEAHNQYALLDRAAIRRPLQFSSAREIDRLVIVKAPHAKISFERAFFLCSSEREYAQIAQRMLDEGIVSEQGLHEAVIEEYALGPTINLNFFYSPILGELELLGTDTRRQTNIDGIRAVPPAQSGAVAHIAARYEEAGHIAATLTESMLESAFAMGTRFVEATQAEPGGGIIGPFALQCAIVAGPPKSFICYDVSLRIPGSPGTRFTPYSAYRWGRDVSTGERIAMEVVFARDARRLEEIVS